MSDVLQLPLAHDDLNFLTTSGMGATIRAHDWRDSPLGPPEAWPQSLRSALSICLHSSFPTAIYWGPELRLLYNDAWATIPAERHPWALGRPAAEVWTDIWDVVGPQFARVMEQGEGYSTYDQMLPMVRDGVVRETYWNYSITPIHGEDGRVVGIFNQGHETTERVLAERQKAAETERLRRMFDQAPAFMAMLRGPDHVFELANPAYLQLVGRHDIVGKPVRDALPELEGQGFFELLDGVYRNGTPYVGRQVPVDLKRDGDGPPERAFVEFVYQPLRDAAGNVTGIFVTGYDVTELRATQDRLRLAQRAGGIGSFEIDPATRTITVSPEFCELWGLDWQPVLPLDRTVARIHPDDRPRVLTGEPVITEESLGYVEYRISRGDTGEERWIARRGEAVFDEAQGLVRFAGVVYDITDRRRAEEALREREQQLSALIDQTTAGFAEVDLTGRFTLINDRFCEIAGRSREELLQLKMQEITHPDDLARNVPLFERAVADGTPYVHEKRYVRPDGSIVWVNNSVTVIRRSDGQPYGVLAVTIDITERKRAEDRQLLLINELNHRVKNTLAIVQGLAQQSFRSEASPEDARANFEARLAALSAAHNLLTQQNWEAAALSHILRASVAATAGADIARVSFEGPELLLAPQTAVSVTMAVHELCTNAIKYGALSNETGHVEVRWAIVTEGDGGRLRLTWRERGGPPVSPPKKRGFGTRMIERGLSAELRGAVTLSFEPEGLICTIDASLPKPNP